MEKKVFEFGVEGNANEPSISLSYVNAIREKYSMIFNETLVPNFYRTLFRSMAIVLKHFEAKATPKIGFSLLNDKGDFRIGAILTYQAPEEGEEDDNGNWNLAFTLDKEDMKELDKAIDSHSDAFWQVASSELYSAIFGHFENAVSMNQMFDEAINNIIVFLDRNSNDGSEVELTLPGIFTASCGFEDGAKVYSIVPGATIKQIIKDDANLNG